MYSVALNRQHIDKSLIEMSNVMYSVALNRQHIDKLTNML